MKTKTVFKSSELAHVWANEGAPKGRCPSSMSFDGDAFYSYSTVIARRMRHKGKIAYLIDDHKFSVTTSLHQSNVRYALSDAEKKFTIDNGSYNQSLDFSPADLRDWYLNDSKPTENSKSRYAHVRADETLRQLEALNKAIDVCEFFGIKHARLVNLRAKGSGEADKALDVQQSYYAKKQAASEARRKAQREREIAKAITLAEEIQADRWKIANLSSYAFASSLSLLDSRPDLQSVVREAFEDQEKLKIEAWRKGESVSFDWYVPVMLRRVGANMETSKGAVVDMLDALKAYRFAIAKRAQGWERNGEQFQVGYYNLDRVNPEGVIAGCHRVSWDEIERFANEMGWNK